MRTRNWTAGSLAALFAFVTLTCQALAAAWTLPAGDAQIIAGYTYDEASEAFNDEGDRDLDADFYKHELSVLMEYGALDYLTVYIQPHFQWLDVNDVEEAGHAFTDVGLRLRVLQQDQHVFSLQGQVSLPGDVNGTNEVTLSSSEIEAELRALFGTSFMLGTVPAFVDLQGGYRYREGNPPDEWHADATFGWQPDDGAEFLLQSFNTWSEGQGDDPLVFPYFRQHKVQASLVMHATQELSLQVGGFYTWAGQNVIAEEGLIVGAWYRF
ncbi:hypothetical protein JYU02_00380 [bacterium AH-315-P15]|nr:hypothetical protein [bacterium AH-315-P15]